MASGYQDWHRLTYLQEQSASMYWADVLRILLEDPVIEDMQVIDPNATYYAWNSITLSGEGRLIALGNIVILGD